LASRNKTKVCKDEPSCDLAVIEVEAKDLTKKEQPNPDIPLAKNANFGDPVFSINPEKANQWSNGRIIAIDDVFIYAVGLEIKKGFSGTAVYNSLGELTGVVQSLLEIKDPHASNQAPKAKIAAIVPFWSIAKFLGR
jgi:hypothetical protein